MKKHKQNKCDLCEGTRVRLKINPEGGVDFINCDCVARDVQQLKLERANVPAKYRDFTLSKLSKTFCDQNKEDLQIVIDYVNNLKENIEEGCGLFFQSDPGLAKSSIAAWIVREALQQGFDCHMGRMSRYISAKFEALRDPDARGFVFDLINCDLLVIDEIEKVYMVGDEDAMTEILVSEFFGELYDNKCSLIITSNSPRSELGKLPLHILDRFDEMITDVIFVGESHRKQ